MTTFKLSSPLSICRMVLSQTPTLLCCLELEILILVIDRTVVLELPIKDGVVTLLCSFYVFNIGYLEGFNQFLHV